MTAVLALAAQETEPEPPSKVKQHKTPEACFNAFIDPAITGNPSLKYDPEAIQSVEFEAFLGEEATKIRNRVWQEVKNA